MEMGFLLGLFVGLVAAVVAVVIVFARRAHTKNAKIVDVTRVIPRPAPASTRMEVPADAPAGIPAGASERRERTGNTLIVGEVEDRESELAASIQEVRDMLLTLAGLISRTETASGQAADAFATARESIRSVQASQSSEIREAQRLLLAEVDRVLATNAALHSELDRANRGIADQRKQIEELRVQARVDGLTRIPNRAAFDERLQEYAGLLQRAAVAFSLLILDIDHFKRVNDDHGHVNGDRILRGIASKIAASIRGNDFAARYGGEEFAVILPATPLAEALEVAERIRADIAKTNFRMDQKVLKITISGGLAEAAPSMSPTQLIAAADAALYESKNSGRNRVTVSTPQQ